MGAKMTDVFLFSPGVLLFLLVFSFTVAAPATWNSLPLLIRNSSSISGFRRQLETFLYKSVFEPL